MEIIDNEKEQQNISIIRLSRSYWHDKNGIHEKLSIRRLKRKCTGYQLFEEDTYEIGAEETIPRIVNLNDCVDGIYQIIIYNEQRDWETGNIDDYDYKLIPFINSPTDEKKDT